MTQKPKVAFFDFSSCEGCQIELTNFGDADFLELLNHIDIVEFREAMSEKTDDIDIACIEGSFTRESEKDRLIAIRNRAKIVIAYGACAHTAGINALKNHTTDFKKAVYGQDADQPHLNSNDKALPISHVIKVDYFAPGCPMSKYEFLNIVSHLLHGKEPVIPTYPVCVECKRNETICRYDVGDHCMGQVAMAGCGAPCPSQGIPCEACRGFCEQANLTALENTLINKAGFSASRAKDKLRMFTNALLPDTSNP
ncbi:MAG: NADH:ubiquinone oxidoreductase [Deltaproteobacteria bacterium]|nr:NADH:ubiquinone oxidoreductase [Deltaproteobacteria bacterium]